MTLHPDDVTLRHDFTLIFDVVDGNPNGDPDSGNQPRIDPETGQGLVTDVCLKRKVRDYVSTVAADNDHRIFISPGIALNTVLAEAVSTAGIDLKKKDTVTPTTQAAARDWLCARYYDVRMFGAVLNTGAGKDASLNRITGPAQINFARSVHPVAPYEHGITRVVKTKEGEADSSEMGTKWTVPYGCYVTHGFVTPSLAARTNASDADLALLWEALVNMFEVDRSAARGLMSTRGLYVFTHARPTGCASAAALFDRISVTTESPSPRSFTDITVNLDDEGLPDGVQLDRLAS